MKGLDRLPVRCQAILLGVFLLVSGMVARAGTITVELVNPPESGVVVLLLFDSADAFGDLQNPVQEVRQPLGGDPVYVLKDIPQGEYALVVYYDENDNGLIDRIFIGIPKEPIGFANGYEPKGPPSYQRAAFLLAADESRHFQVRLRRPLGRFGRVGVGVGVILSSSPYRDDQGSVSQWIPAITYRGERVQIFGPLIRVGLVGTGAWRLAATGRYRMGVYEADESPYLMGMGDREGTFMAGLALRLDLHHRVNLTLGLEHDVLNRIGGSQAAVDLSKAYQFGMVRLTPRIGLDWQGEKLANYDFGVPAQQATAERPAYRLDGVFSPELGLGLFMELNRDWLLVADAGLERLPQQVTRSPIVDKKYVIKGFATINYVF